jgi:DNA-binding NtrC family response regulator
MMARLFLVNYSWPGNVRQLENFIKRLILLSTERIIDINQIKSLIDFEDHSFPGKAESGSDVTVEGQAGELSVMSLDDMEREYIEKVLKHYNYNISEAAKSLKISRKTLHNKLKKYNIQIKKSLTAS